MRELNTNTQTKQEVTMGIILTKPAEIKASESHEESDIDVTATDGTAGFCGGII